MSGNAKVSSATSQILLDILEQDRRQVMLFVLICFAIHSFTLSNSTVIDLPLLIRIFLVFSLTLFIISGVLFFTYTKTIHLKRFKGLQSITDNDPKLLREKLYSKKEGVWSTAGKYYKMGSLFLNFALILYVVFYILLLFKGKIF